MADALFNQEINKTSEGYKVVLSYVEKLTNNNPVTKYAELDLQDGGVSVKSNVTISDHPTANGFNISDHIYREPITISMKGEYGEDGLKAKNWSGDDRLSTIQLEFETLQRAGVKFNITIMKNSNISDKSNKRYISRQNMILTSISWTEGQNVLDFSFDFKEAISSNTVLIEPVLEVTDPNLPEITDLKAASVAEELIGSDEIVRLTIEQLQNLSLVDDKTLAYVGTSVVAASIAGFALDVVAGIVYICAAAAISIPVVGLLVVAAAAIVAAVVSVFTIYNAIQRTIQLNHYKELGHYFKITDDMTEVEKNKHAEELVTFLATVKTNIDTALADIKIYGIAKADRQECSLEVNGNYYIQQIELANSKCTSSEKIYSIKSLLLGSTENASMPEIVGLGSFDQGTDSSDTIYFRDVDDNKYRVYIVNKATQSDEAKGTTSDEDLLNYDFVVSPYKLCDISDKIANVVKESIG